MTRYINKWAALHFLILLPFLSISQDNNLGNWLIYIGSKKINSNWNAHNEIQYRNYNAIGDLEQLLLRTGIGYSIEDNNNLLLGYGFIRSENYIDGTDEKSVVNEHRIFQQFITKQKVKGVSLQHRYRFEQRFVESDFKLRLRYFLGLNIPLISNKEEVRFYLSVYNEIFMNTKGNAFDRNRLYSGLGHKINSNLKVELGYMNQFLSNENRDQINLLAFVNF